MARFDLNSTEIEKSLRTFHSNFYYKTMTIKVYKNALPMAQSQ